MTKQKNATNQAGKTSDFEAINCDYAANTTEHQAKRKIDLLSWSKFGGEEGTKPSCSRQPKQSWQRQQPKSKAHTGNLSTATRMPTAKAINAPSLIVRRDSINSKRFSSRLSKSSISCLVAISFKLTSNTSDRADASASACAIGTPASVSRRANLRVSKVMVAMGRSLSRLPSHEHRQASFSFIDRLTQSSNKPHRCWFSQ